MITDNVKAVKSYEGIGFEICKNYKCFGGIISVESQNNYALKEVIFNAINWNKLPNQKYILGIIRMKV